VTDRLSDRDDGPSLRPRGKAVEPGLPSNLRPLMEQRRTLWLTGGVVLAWTGLIVLTHFLGLPIVQRKPRTGIFAAPLVARFDPRLHPTALLPLLLAVLVLIVVPRRTENLGWRWILLLAFLAAGAWAVSLALTDGVGELTRPIRDPVDYLHDVPLVGSPGVFLSHFVQRIGRYQQHVRAHPPGMVLVLWTMSRVGLRGAGWEAVLEIGGGAAMVPAALIALREVAGERQARAAAPLVAFAPAAVWIATSGDALFAGMSAWAVALVIVSIRRSALLSDGFALAGGVLFGAALFLSYGSSLLAVLPVIVALKFRRVRPLFVATLGAGIVVLGFAAAGFWWVAGLHASIGQYGASVARFRPQSYFWLGNLGAFAIVLGPATGVGLARLRDRWTWLLVAGGLLAVVVADSSGLSKAEVERIWLPFAPWILLAGSALAGRGQTNHFSRAAQRAWLALTLGTGLAIQLLLRTVW
jgi:methylthioxylose transferase